MTATTTGRRPTSRVVLSARRAEQWAGVVLASPALLVFTVFMFVPLAMTVWYSLNRYSGFGRMRFLGLDNYRHIAGDPTFWQSLLNTVVLTVITVPLGIVLGLGAALLLNRALPARGLFRALVYVPVVISGVAAGIIWLRLFDPLIGLLNQLLSSLSLPTVDWQGNGLAAMVSVIVVTTWQGVGFGMVVYLAGLQAIPGELYEAGAVDGAVGWRRFRHITWPLLRPTTFFLVVYSIIGSFQVFDVVYVLTRGGPGTSTTFLVQYAYDQGFNQRRQGYAAAIGVILYVIVLAFTVLQWRLDRRRDEA
ncbi:carbohydrate ABC transporter permease [Lapillicoccus jejuensis]|uniref:Carbohydrate ABC transporter membrane protein 1 (CUT1 family) n=1 Tax=Lapillicoccus jejuensis TaxID=402171 RepID=A0A542E169_9MICO|nr:sugar ABC transporter permease [Lapillicoccus jejuensis]TQJ09065.1 carbohydrate ABC transporter membrane protein 1 (CUT1 family) [Lapillicoccus jejuensis]